MDNGNGQIPQNLINRINELANKKKTVGLTKEELAEQKSLRETYLAIFREGFRSRIEMLQVFDKEGKEVTPEKIKNIQRKRGLRDN
ncbi:Uncharacterized protein YnzC, UPF0291/DUF896 family [Ligilactobacillus sp. WC1T17]|uniref:UPF0291 protein SAMN05216431_10255 n=1 Tax=Ligilactobacillus ruminis TaxID=1623 RepID=A0ABY1A9H4_9LACO|nr:Uncharacterized protein YnzC, UPF0291/DUF896 family [Ligilactobacillus ruminis]